MRPDLLTVLRVKLVVTVVAWAAPLLLLPASWFRFFGLSLATTEALVFARLLGAAYIALCVGYAMALLDIEKHGGMRIVGIVSNGLASAVLWILIVRGVVGTLPIVGEIFLIASAIATAALTVALVIARKGGIQRAPGLSSALKRDQPAPHLPGTAGGE